MVNKEANKRFPQVLEAIATITEELKGNVPNDIQRIALAGRNALFSNNPRKSINKQFSSLRSAHPDMFPNALNWLRTDSTRSLFSEYGCFWAWSSLLSAISKIVEGEKPHVAFGMDKSGRPEFWGFTVEEDAAIYAQNLHLNESYPIDAAKQESADVFGTDKRNINKSKIKYISRNEAKQQSELIRWKHKL